MPFESVAGDVWSCGKSRLSGRHRVRWHQRHRRTLFGAEGVWLWVWWSMRVFQPCRISLAVVPRQERNIKCWHRSFQGSYYAKWSGYVFSITFLLLWFYNAITINIHTQYGGLKFWIRFFVLIAKAVNLVSCFQNSNM